MIYKEHFIDFLKDRMGLAYFNGPRTEIVVQCPKCEKNESRKHGHLYISCTEPVFNCFKCEYRGIVHRLITELGGDPKDFLDIEISSYTKTRSYTEDLFSETHRSDYKKEEVVDDDATIFKKKYLLNRLGDIDLDRIPGIIYHVKDFLNKNKLEVSEYVADKLDVLDEKYVGFLTTKGTKIVFRNCDVKDEDRFYVYSIIQQKKFFPDFYGIKNNAISENTNTIVLCEGVFDLLVAMTDDYFKELKENSCYWAAVLGKSNYYRVVISVLDYCKLPKANVVILSDKDLRESNYTALHNLPFVKDLKVYWNKYGKDFGERPIYPIIYQCSRRTTNVKQHS